MTAMMRVMQMKKNEYCSSSTNEESTDESRNINDSGDEELAKEKESGRKKNSVVINKVTNRRSLKGYQNMTKANKNLKKCSSSTAAHLKVTLKPNKTRSDLLRVGAFTTFISQRLISNDFKVVEEIESLSKRNKKLSLRL